MTKVCMFVTNNCKHDFRVLKEARTLADAGYDVRIVAILDETTVPYEELDGVRIIRVALYPIYVRIPQFFRLIVWRMKTIRSRADGPAMPGAQLTASPQGKQTADSPGSAPKQPWPRRALGTVWRAVWRAMFPESSHRLLKFMDYWVRSWKAARDEPADIYHSNDLDTLPIGYWAKRRTGGRLVYDSHELYTETPMVRRFEKRVLRLLEGYLIRRADRVITVSQSIAEELARRYRIPVPEVVMNCPPRVDLERAPPLRTLRGDLGLPDEVPIIVHSGGIMPGRGLHNVVRSLAHLREGVLALVGYAYRGVDRQIKELAEQEGLTARVVFVDAVPPYELVGYIASANVGVAALQAICLSVYYSAPNKLFEYINAGLPVVASHLPEMRQVVEDHKIGRAFDPAEPADIAAAIEWVLSDKDRYDDLRRNVLEAAEVFNWGNESKKLLAVYAGLV